MGVAATYVAEERERVRKMSDANDGIRIGGTLHPNVQEQNITHFVRAFIHLPPIGGRIFP